MSAPPAPEPTQTPPAPRAKTRRRKVAAEVALALLEAIRDNDLPEEVLTAEDPSQTMPRRLGLSEVVESQIRRFREQARRREYITDEQARDLFRLVLRRPDSEEIFLQAGRRLVGDVKPFGGLRRLYPQRFLYFLVRRRLRKRILSLLRRPIGAFAPGPFVLEARGHFLMDMDPGGDACYLLSGLAEAFLSRYLGREVRVRHALCEGRREELCRWALEEGAVSH